MVKAHLAVNGLEQGRGIGHMGIRIDDKFKAAGRLEKVHLVRARRVMSQADLTRGNFRR